MRKIGCSVSEKILKQINVFLKSLKTASISGIISLTQAVMYFFFVVANSYSNIQCPSDAAKSTLFYVYICIYFFFIIQSNIRKK